MKRLIVNADDLGWSQAVTRGIVQAHREGLLTSTTVMANLPGAAEALALARQEAPDLAVGIHLNLTEGKPLAPAAEVAPLLDAEGNLRRSLATLLREARRSEAVRRAAAREFEAQVAWARDQGLTPSHLDSHKHVHVHPAILPLVVDLARRHGVRAVRTTAEIRLPHLYHLLPDEWGVKQHVRQWLAGRLAARWGTAARQAVRRAGLATTDWFFGVRATGGVSAWLFLYLLQYAPDGTGELMVHPGLRDADDRRPTRLAESRPNELAAVCDPQVRAAAEAHGWTWATYGDLDHD